MVNNQTLEENGCPNVFVGKTGKGKSLNVELTVEEQIEAVFM